ncbi:12173_t:CDS:1 [Dentiscutata erythropus]|uniref:12173_t:CDS:1 n=1 Tax=Dentiscutata erythropus TaxID=1348616 RepID=A0A9N9D4I6_9GLOM|nr:12173_t:CDS:1 [Dentiscutata erythropus]
MEVSLDNNNENKQISMDQALEKIEGDINKAVNSIRIASVSLLSCYTENASSVEEFTKLRRSVTTTAKIYCNYVMPFSGLVIRNIKSFLEDYIDFTLEEFEEYLDDKKSDAEQYGKLCQYTLELHQNLLTDFFKTQSDALEVCKILKLKCKEFETERVKLKHKHDVAAGVAIGLAMIPYVNLIASPAIGYLANEWKKKSIARKEESFIAAAAASCINDYLISSIQEYIVAMTEISGFFKVMEGDLSTLVEHHEHDKIKKHYIKVKAISKRIIESCDSYTRSIPECEASLKAINNDYDSNYVQKWFRMTKNKKGQTLLEMGKELSQYNNKIIGIFGNMNITVN